MAGKISFLVGLGAGYVLGARSGRERYDQIAEKAQQVWRDPRVQEKAGQAGQVVKEKVASATSNGDGSGGRSDDTPGSSAPTTGSSGGKLP